ncbi:MAG: hypothetical protein HC787_02235 [Nostocaceae cyanobacterium CSU_2_110]|nr:hypothetical protein [Richelia sp. RM1_1_1]NJS16121.1 hypothetical protein [Nostocaceae cyanobacterium CSU_2_110]
MRKVGGVDILPPKLSKTDFGLKELGVVETGRIATSVPDLRVRNYKY